MLTITSRRDDSTDEAFPWAAPHAAPEDRAVGYELELIELVRRRDLVADAEGAHARELDAEIAEVLVELAEVSAQIAA